MIKNILVFFLFSFLLSEGEFVDGIVAKVGSNTIIHSEVLQTIQMQAMQRGIDISKNQYYIQENHDNILKFLINQYVIFEIAKEDTLIEVSGDEISSTLDNEIKMMTQRAGTINSLEDILGQSIQEYKMTLWDEIEKRLLIERYQQSFMSNITVSRPEVEQFYQKRNLLNVRITGADVAEATLFFASSRTSKTTGAMHPVDGGIRDAFPR